MRHFPMIAGGLALLPLAAAAQESCGRYPIGEDRYVCSCDAGAGEGTAWGSGPYTADSDLCTAARHAGVIGAEGGVIEALQGPGGEQFAGSERNGITTRDWGTYPDSVSFNPKGPRASETGDLALCGAFPGGQVQYTCACDGDEAGSVWGSGPYTADSDICTAARHATMIDERGGVVTVIGIQGLESYMGSDFGGVSTRDWGSYGESFVFNWNATGP